ncbi:FAD-binding oxidoreductase [Streptomyces sp. LP05-1]|uniref:FAD-binding oxidoreductase n=1 Tax=Streptomyces pyxinae TaxID=2970734 RepID=A0ABT2CHJ5_9ACTN|nr:FAD-binding oxidoreductase [Streptomyces sp. LP05-1]MCS0636875.1 FAD-binding oxidoreductase [Streptomyces sp. LP05-1]
MSRETAGRRAEFGRRGLLRAGLGAGAGAAGLGAGIAAAGPATAAGTTTARGSSAVARAAGRAAGRVALAAAWTALGKGLDGSLLRPGDHDYDTARQLFNPRFDGARPAGVAYCAGPQDVRECLAFARQHGIPVAVRSGGHSYAGWSSGNGKLVIDVQRMAKVAVSGSTATVGAGAKLIDVYDRLTATGRTIPAGSCPTVGVSGLALGGGIGVVARAYGLTSDSITGAGIVTADGRLRQVDATHDPDLFWALRGGGNANFGVVTSLGFRTHAAPSCVTFFLSWPWSRAADVVREWQRWAPDNPDEIWANLHLSAPAGGRPGRVRVGGLSLGTRSDLLNRLDRFADRVGVPASSVSVNPHTFMDAMKIMGGVSGRTVAQAHQRGTLPGRTKEGGVARESYAARSDFYTRDIPEAGVRALLARVEALAKLSGGGAGSVALDSLGGAVSRVKPAATAFVHRDARFLAQYIVSWPDRAPAATVAGHQEWLNGTYAAMRSWASGFAYQNYTDPALRDWRRAYFGTNADRLARIKQEYDPQRVFGSPQGF